ncbi:hypothetical protein AMTR_s00034p00206140 [Amborella trichopoda]|uniref:Uncharacterized protein n=1 Tax=Amborella trichopoda TaxID=13333 RepID=W1PXR0_AMBTC|nr:hypothetical protein AMTR_s00034p00206140 [Amborella trichopoda]
MDGEDAGSPSGTRVERDCLVQLNNPHAKLLRILIIWINLFTDNMEVVRGNRLVHQSSGLSDEIFTFLAESRSKNSGRFFLDHISPDGGADQLSRGWVDVHVSSRSPNKSLEKFPIWWRNVG